MASGLKAMKLQIEDYDINVELLYSGDVTDTMNNIINSRAMSVLTMIGLVRGPSPALVLDDTSIL